MKTCPMCEKKNLKQKFIKEYHANNVGIPHVYILNLEAYECSHCGEEIVVLPAFGLLMFTIAQAVIFKEDKITGEEIKFLLNFFDLSQKSLASKIGAPEKTVSFWITGKAVPSPAYSLKLRKFFSKTLAEYAEGQAKELGGVVKKLKEVIEELRDIDSMKSYLQHRAQQAVKVKIFEIQISDNYDVPTFQIPKSKSFLQLRH